MHADAFGKIAVAVGIFGDVFAHQRQQFERIQIVCGRERLINFGKFQHQKRAAGFEYAVHLFERGIFMGHVAQPERHGNQIKIIVGKRQLFSIAHGNGQGQPFVEQAVAPDGEHGGIDVGQPHFAFFAHALCPAARQIARAAGDVEHFAAPFQMRGVDGEMLPHAVQSERHYIVHDVVIFGDRVEHFGNFGGFFAFVYGLVAEVGFFVLLLHDGFSFWTGGGRNMV